MLESGIQMNSIHIQNNIVNEFMETFRIFLDKLFIQKNHKVNAQIIINELKERNIDFVKVKTFMDKLPKGEWNLNVFINSIDELNEIFGLSDENIREYSVNEVNEKDIKQIRWQILIESMLEYSKFANEFYDALKYNKSAGLSLSQIKLLNEMMMVFKLIKDKSKGIYGRYKDKRLTSSSLRKINMERLPIEYLILRILYISLNLKKGEDKNFAEFSALLGKERVSLTYNKVIMPKFN